MGNFFLKKRNAYILNMIASITNAGEAVVVMLVAARTISLEEVGILSIAFTIANLMMTIGKFGMRNYQVTDFSSNTTFADYRITRYVTCTIMLLVMGLFCGYGFFYKRYTLRKIVIVVGVFLMYLAEAYEDVYGGLYQRLDRLDVAALIFIIRWIVDLLVCCILLILTHNVIIAVFASVVIAWVVLAYTIKKTKCIIPQEQLKRMLDREGIKKLLLECIPLALSSGLSFYITNSSKYAIDGRLSEEIQACYGFVAMPVFVIVLLNMILYQPILVDMAYEWSNKNIKKFFIRIIKHLLLIVILALGCLWGALKFGITILSWIYSVNLDEYKSELIVLMVGGLWLAISGFFCAIMTIMRKIKGQLVAYVITAMLAFFITPVCVDNYGTLGAAVINAILLFLCLLFLGGQVFGQIYKSLTRE